jgi:5-methylcytosine-specific restriction endonuclease McrBC GTP-binding regulatory subunit McrB
VIDEINRAELGAVLGEVMMLIEYRNRTVPLPYSQQSFSIPRNVVLLATMNTADRSLALVDFALRRRFHAIRMPPDRDVLSLTFGSDGELAVTMFDLVQEFVNDADFSPGHSYWMTKDPSAETLDMIWRYELKPYLEEYWFESRTRLDELDKAVQTLLGEGA